MELNQKEYISESEILKIIKETNIPEKEIREKVIKHNEEFIKKELKDKEKYLDEILHPIDKNLKLDEEQRRAVLIDEDHCLIVAGAGAGKTTTMAAKVKYLVDVKKVSPKDIIVISYTKKAIGELKERINECLNVPVEICTFHSFGYKVLRMSTNKKYHVVQNPYSIFMEIIEKDVYYNKNLLKKLVLFFSNYLEVPLNSFDFKNLNEYHKAKAEQEYSTLKGNLKEYNEKAMDRFTKKTRTINNEILRSREEVMIANFLYLNNISYEYEKKYEYQIKGLRKPYTPDFYIEQGTNKAYIEHFGISENHKSALYNEMDLSKYLNSISQKIRWHESFHTSLITTYSSYNDKVPFLNKLENQLKEKGFILKRKDEEEVYRKIVETDKDKYIIKFVFLVMTFISHFKTNGYDISKFEEFKKIENVRDRLFLDLIEEIYKYYEQKLEALDEIDFEDMINMAEKVLDNYKKYKIEIPYKYIVIDEYQDIAMQRFNLAKKLSEISHAKIIAVGDDWQSIFRFAGSEIDLFTDFLKQMGDGLELQITHTYRNSQELIDIAGNFIQKNPMQIKKKLSSIKHLENPIVLKEFEDKISKTQNKLLKLEEAIEEIIEEYGEKSNLLIIGRYNFDKHYITHFGNFADLGYGKLRYYKYPNFEITFMTAHSSKGLGYDNVIILNAENTKFGFPSKVEDDTIMKFVVNSDESFDFAEERRLFYVALTRTKNRVYVLVPISQPSEFIVELINDHNVKHDNNLSNELSLAYRARCPKCGCPLKYEFRKNYGLDLWICTNDHEVCDFMTNNLDCMEDIYSCDKCNDGYMIVKRVKTQKDTYIMGCTNYKEDKTGCNNSKRI